MRRSTSLLIPVLVITTYYVALVGVLYLVVRSFPRLHPYLPLGGILELADSNSFEQLRTGSDAGSFLVDHAAFKLAIACVGTVILMVPISWVYFITNRAKSIDASFTQTIVILPVVVAGIAMVVQNSLALAFSLAGIVAAVRFRFTLDLPSHALYIFAAIGVGLGSGIGALGVAAVISAAFVYVSLVLWKLDYGRRTHGPFLSMLTRRDREPDDEL